MQLLKLISFETMRITKNIYQLIILIITSVIVLGCGIFFLEVMEKMCMEEWGRRKF